MNKIIQITAGRGPAECTWVAAQVLKKIIQEAKDNNLEPIVLQHEAGNENSTLGTATLQIKGKTAAQFIATWVGTIQWIGKSTFRTFHKRSNWYIGVFEVKTEIIETVSEKDIQYQAMRSSGAGGQHVNKVSSAVRATHTPTGISVTSMDTRSQHQNKKLATERLLEKLKNNQLQQIQNGVQQQWTNQMAIERGNPIRVFEGSDFKKPKAEKTFKAERQKLKNDLRNYVDN